MTSSDLLARLRFLDDGAHLLAILAPETSRHLMSKHNSLSFDHDLESIVQRQICCGACGTIIIVGRQGTLEVGSVGPPPGRRKGETKPKQISTLKHRKVMEYTCNCCRGITRFPINLLSKPPSHKRKSSRAPTMPQTTALSLEQPASGPATSSHKIKNRTKSKNKGGLAAILAKQKESQTSSAGFGLDLMDFMNAS